MNQLLPLLHAVGEEGYCRDCGFHVYWVRHRSGALTPYDSFGDVHVCTGRLPELEELELGVRSYNALYHAQIRTIEQLTKKTASELLRIKNLGRQCLNEIEIELEKYNLSLQKEELA